MFARLGKMVTAHPWRVLAVWLAVVGAIVPLAPSLSSVSSSDQKSLFTLDSAPSVPPSVSLDTVPSVYSR